ncbi:hypothetical protein M514_06428, partial [Trichuris suis]
MQLINSNSRLIAQLYASRAAGGVPSADLRRSVISTPVNNFHNRILNTSLNHSIGAMRNTQYFVFGLSDELADIAWSILTTDYCGLCNPKRLVQMKVPRAGLVLHDVTCLIYIGIRSGDEATNFHVNAQLGLLEFSLLRCQLQKRVTQSEVMQSDFLPTLNMKRADSKSYV